MSIKDLYIEGLTYYNKKENKEYEFSCKEDISLSKKLVFVKSVIDTLFQNDFYNYIMKDCIFYYKLITTFTDINFDNIDEEESLIDYVDEFINETDIIEKINDNVAENVISDLYNAVNKSIAYKTGISDFSENLGLLINNINSFITNSDNNIDLIRNFMEKINGLNLTNDELIEKIIKLYSKDMANDDLK